MNRYEILKGEFFLNGKDTQKTFDNLPKMLDYMVSYDGDWFPADDSLMRTIGFKNQQGDQVSIDLTDYKRTMYLLPGHIQKSLHLMLDRTELIRTLKKKAGFIEMLRKK